MADKWIEVDIYLRDYSRTNEVICSFIRPFVERCKTKHGTKSWHFFREPQIRLRFFGEEETISSIRNELSRLTKVS